MAGNVVVSFLRGVLHAFWISWVFWYHSMNLETEDEGFQVVNLLQHVYSKHRENKLQTLRKMGVTYEWSELKFCTIMFAINWGMDCWVSYFLYYPVSPQTKVEIHEETSIANDHFNVMWTNGHNLQFLQPNRFLSSSCLGEYGDTQVLTVGPFLHREQRS